MNEQANMAARYEHEIPEGYEVRIEGNKIIIERKKSDDEKIREMMIQYFTEMKEKGGSSSLPYDDVLAYLERQEEQKPTHVPKFKVGDNIKYRGDIYEITTIETNNNGSFYYVSVIGTPSDPDDVKTCIGPAGEKDIRLLSSQSHWKPSKDEITAIEVAVKYLLAHTSDEQLRKNVISVFEHLKQL